MIFGKDLTEQIKAVLAQKNVFAVTDDNVFRLYAELFDPARTFVFPAGESQKQLAAVSGICAFLHQSGADRHSKIAAAGGGVAGDIAGFAAAVYMRGIPWVNIPTTLLAQCDSAVGGKTGVDLGAYKNIIGAFHFPEEVYFSAHFLKSLPGREFLCGLGEIIKTACLSPKIFTYFTQNEQAVYRKNESVLANLVRLCADFKDSVVRQDPFEKTGLRKILNYGHTAGHAFEAADNHRLSHGEYVLHGIRAENRMCRETVDPGIYGVIERWINRALNGAETDFDLEKAVEAAAGDKKNAGGKISVVAVVRPGEHREIFFTKEEFKQKLAEALS